MTRTDLPATANPDWGFFGAIARHAEPAEAWALALPAIAAATRFDHAAARAFLDSRHGRHFADDVANRLRVGLALPAAIEAAVGRWMGWRIGGAVERLHGIPRDLPYLTGFVGHCAIEAEANA